jgi:D-3-phosphoglycerate dehydrogenase / 2-oxoglutarate reductase
MFQIQTRNSIAQEGLALFPKEKYQISDSGEAPDAIVLRSYNMHKDPLPTSLKAIGRAGAGVNNIPVDLCTQSGIVVFNAPGANANAVKELVLAGMLLAARNLIAGASYAMTLASEGARVPELVEKNKSRFSGFEISGKRLGVIGLGAIGMMVANNAVALGMRVEGYDPFISVKNAWALSDQVQPSVGLAKLLSGSDFITLHMPLTPDTNKFINAETLKTVKRGAILLNFARAEIVDNEAILEALDSGLLGKYVTDFPTEALIKHPNVICIPHLGASTEEAETNCAVMVANQIKDYLEDGNISNSVNFPNCTLERTGTYRLILMNENVPNMVGQITSLLAQDCLNIMEMVNKSRGNLAYNIVDFNGDPKTDLMDRLRGITGVRMARLL